MYVAGVGAAVSSASMGPIFAGLATGPAAPFVMAAMAAVGPLTKVIKGMIQGCGQSCVDATKYADMAEQNIKELHRTYFGQPQRCREAQVAALQYIDGVFQWMDNGCRALGTAAGGRCISERLVRGGSAPWCPKPGGVGCDWITLYRDPIANDTGVTDCGGLGGLIGGGGGNSGGLAANIGGLFGNGQGGGFDSTTLLLIVVVLVLVMRRG